MACTRRTEAEKQEIIEGWRASGLPLKKFCRERGVPARTVRYWLRPRTEDPAPTQFVDVDVVDSRLWAFAVTLSGSGHRVEVPPGFDAKELRRLVEALC